MTWVRVKLVTGEIIESRSLESAGELLDEMDLWPDVEDWDVIEGEFPYEGVFDRYVEAEVPGDVRE